MRNSEKGFTLIEVVAALVILAIVAVPLAKTFMDSFKFQTKSQNETEAMKVAQFVAEQLKDGKNFYGIDAMDSPVNNSVEKRSEDITADMGELTDKYNITITINNEQKGQNISGNTPTEFAYVIQTNGEVAKVIDRESVKPAGFTISSEDIANFVIRTNRDDNSEEKYSILIRNESKENEADFRVDKRTTARVDIYVQGEKAINLTKYTSTTGDSERLSNIHTKFYKYNLGKNESVTSKTEDLYDVTVTVASRTNETVRATMNTAFTIKREADDTEGEF